MKVILNKIFIPLLFFMVMSCAKDSEAQEIEKDLFKEIAEKILAKTNDIRKSQGKTDLAQNDEMDILATLHSENMVDFNFFAHVDHEDKSPSERANALSFSWTSIAENIGQVPWFENVLGCGDTRSAEALAECMVEGWKNSPPHYKNILGDYVYLGVGIQFTPKAMGYGTQVFR